MKKLTKAQKRILDRMALGEPLIRHFDVWGGYWWTIGYDTEVVQTRTAWALTDAKRIVEGRFERPFSGRHLQYFELATPAHPHTDIQEGE